LGGPTAGFGPPGFNAGGGGAAPLDPNQVTAREQFSPVQDYNNPDRNLQYRAKFVESSESLERSLYGLFIGMLNEIDRRTIDRQRYDDWLVQKREDVIKFAEDWRNVESGKTMMIENTLFMVTPQPLPVTPNSAINIVEKSRVTPQDLLDPDGTVKKPQLR
jgi:hypothetical protein